MTAKEVKAQDGKQEEDKEDKEKDDEQRDVSDRGRGKGKERIHTRNVQIRVRD